jgi:hypothetical protein
VLVTLAIMILWARGHIKQMRRSWTGPGTLAYGLWLVAGGWLLHGPAPSIILGVFVTGVGFLIQARYVAGDAFQAGSRAGRAAIQEAVRKSRLPS